MLEQPTDYLPAWASTLIAALFGGGAVKFLSVWLENRRLARKDYRETMLERIRELEKVVGRLQVRIGNLRVEVAHLETDNKQLRCAAGLPATTLPTLENEDDGKTDGASDGK